MQPICRNIVSPGLEVVACLLVTELTPVRDFYFRSLLESFLFDGEHRTVLAIRLPIMTLGVCFKSVIRRRDA
jgi:hypothetical protein